MKVEVSWNVCSQSSYDADVIPTSIWIYGMSLPFSLGLLTSLFVIFPLVERITNAKQVQIMTGISGYTYWLSNLIWDQGGNSIG